MDPLVPAAALGWESVLQSRAEPGAGGSTEGTQRHKGCQEEMHSKIPSPSANKPAGLSFLLLLQSQKVMEIAMQTASTSTKVHAHHWMAANSPGEE